MKKLILLFSLLVLTALVLAGCSTGEAFRTRGGRVPTIPSSSVVANSCDADDTCEVKRISAETASIGGAVEISDRGISSRQGSHGSLFLTSDDGFVVISGAQLMVDGSIRVLGFGGGAGNSYACFDTNGLLYQSMDPCN